MGDQSNCLGSRFVKGWVRVDSTDRLALESGVGAMTK